MSYKEKYNDPFEDFKTLLIWLKKGYIPKENAIGGVIHRSNVGYGYIAGKDIIVRYYIDEMEYNEEQAKQMLKEREQNPLFAKLKNQEKTLKKYSIYLIRKHNTEFQWKNLFHKKPKKTAKKFDSFSLLKFGDLRAPEYNSKNYYYSKFELEDMTQQEIEDFNKNNKYKIDNEEIEILRKYIHDVMFSELY